ncbi:MAG: TRAP transporter small permease [Proteobacteria bacterium]|nr:TRAP transporter small permease [Pseudomonadota bacterium]
MAYRMRRLLALTTRGAGFGSALFLTAMMLITVADVSLRALFNLPITGTYDLVQLFLVGSVFLSIPDVFLRGENIVVDLVDHMLGPRAVELLKAAASLFALAFLAVLGWRMVPPARDSIRFGEVSPDLTISLGVHWALMIGGVALSLLAAIWVLVENLQPLLRARDEP